jgi:hypothetical protein
MRVMCDSWYLGGIATEDVLHFAPQPVPPRLSFMAADRISLQASHLSAQKDSPRS